MTVNTATPQDWQRLVAQDGNIVEIAATPANQQRYLDAAFQPADRLWIFADNPCAALAVRDGAVYYVDAGIAHHLAARVPLPEPLFHVKVKPEGKRSWWFLAGGDKINRLRIHAVLLSRERADTLVNEIRAQGITAKVVPA